MKPRSLPSFSTLQWTLALSVALHAGLLTVRFVDPEGLRRALQHSALEVVLVNAQSDEAPTKPQALAQHHLAGGGEAEDKRLASTPLPPSPSDASEVHGDAASHANQRHINELQEQQQQLLQQVRAQLAALPPIDPKAAEHDPELRAELERRQQMAKRFAAIERRLEEENTRPRKRILSPATLGTTYAQYYDDMRRKIEQRGTIHFPVVNGKKLYGELLMTLYVNHDGRILDALVVEGSGNRVLDRMAEAIAHAAAPFGRFTPAMRKETDQIDVTARFRFTRDMTLETSIEVAPSAETLLQGAH